MLTLWRPASAARELPCADGGSRAGDAASREAARRRWSRRPRRRARPASSASCSAFERHGAFGIGQDAETVAVTVAVGSLTERWGIACNAPGFQHHERFGAVSSTGADDEVLALA